MEYFVLDGYVTEHIQMKQDISKLYKQLSVMDPDKERVIAMQERRAELLEPILKEINPKAYENFFIELGAELSDIFSTIFDIRFTDFISK